MFPTRKHHRRGFTLLEALLAAVILATSITAVTMPMTIVTVNDADESRQALATSLVHELMEEILARPFYDPQGTSGPGPEVGETHRGLFDNVDDYHGYTEAPGEITTMDGVVVDGVPATGLSRQVLATYVYVSGQDTGDSPTFIRVSVTVKHGSRVLVSVTRLVYALPE